MKVVNATIPVIGNTQIHFYNDSETVLDFSKLDELERLDDIPHLGLTKTAFTGINHTRLEYTLLQCSIVEIASKVHKDDSDISLSNKVTLDGNISRASSGEDLLKTWFLLSAFGHCQWTHGTERSILQQANSNKEFKDWLIEDFRLTDLKNWCRNTIDTYSTSLFHYVMAVRRITLGDAYDRRKTTLLHYLRNLLLSPEHLFGDDIPKRNKISKLQSYFKRIRMLSIATLDSHYSHSPLELNVQSAISDPKTFGKRVFGDYNIQDKLKKICGLLAEDLYLHRDPLSIQRSYEVNYKEKVWEQYSNNKGSKPKEYQTLKNWLTQGLGAPKQKHLRPLIRLTFEDPATPLLGHQNKFESIKLLENKIGSPPEIRVSVERNTWTGAAHVDVFHVRDASAKTIGDCFCRVQNWAVRSLRAEALRRIRELENAMDEEAIRAEDFLSELQRSHFEDLISKEKHVFNQLFESVITFLIPNNYDFSLKHANDIDYHNDNKPNPLYISLQTDDVTYDEVDKMFNDMIVNNKFKYDSDRLHEISTLRRSYIYLQGDLKIVCPHGLKIYDVYGRSKDEVDGVIISISNEKISITIPEAKNLASKSQSVSEAYEQLLDTVKLLHDNRKFKYRRKRVAGHGAKLHIYLDTQDY